MPEFPTKSSALKTLADDATSRKKFLRMIGGGGGVAAMATLLGACGDDDNDTTSAAAPPATTDTGTTAPTDADTKNDLDILNYALTLEFLETDFYNKVIDAGLFKGDQADLLKGFGDQEQQHVDALSSTITKLGGTPVTAPTTKFDLSDANAVAMLAYTVENLGANAYLAQAPKIKSMEVLAAALSIHTVEARHAATLATVVGEKITPDGAFGSPAPMDKVLETVKPFIAS